MKKRIAVALIICLTVSTCAFAFLWNAERNSKSKLVELAQAEAVHAYIQFADYQNSGDIRRYWDGAAAFRAFQQAYRSAINSTDRAADYLICDEVYGYLIGEPEKCQTYIADIIGTMETLSKNVEDLNGHAQMLALRDALLTGK